MNIPDKITDATQAIAAMACLMTWAGRGFRDGAQERPREEDASAFGHALEWFGHEIERQCAVIDEAKP